MNLPVFTSLTGAIAVDLDGTLLNSRTELTNRSRTALEACIDRKIPVIIATSRPARIFDRIFPADLAEKCSFILMNGAKAIGNPPLSGSFCESLPENILKGIIDCVKEHDPLTRITVEIDGYRFGTNQEIDSATLWQRHAATPEMVFSIDAAITKNPCKIALGGTDVVKLTETLAQRFAGSVSIVGSQLIRPLVNITSPASTKPGALQKLLLPHGIPLSMVLAFGDDIPDIDMLQECGISVAMSNAFPEVKAVCRYETTSNDDDGVAVVLEKMLRETSG